MSAGRKLLSSLVYGKDANAIVGLSIFPEMFKEGELTLYEFILGHVHSFGAIPTEETIEDKLGDVLMQAPEPIEFYLAETEKRYLQGELKKVAIGIQDNLQGQDPDKALHNALNRISELSIKQQRRSIIDFRDAADLIHAEYVAVKQMSDAVGVMFGWPTLDNMTGGLKGGDLCSIVGRPASGKTFMGLYTALHGWQHTKQLPLFVSMEMTNLAITQRLAAMNSHKPLTQLLKGMLSSKSYLSMYNLLLENKQKAKPFWCVDGNLTANVDDLVILCHQLHPSSVWVDGAYLLRHPNPRIGRWDRMTENAEGLKQRIATDLKTPVVASYQFSKEVSKKKKKGDDSKTGSEDIYGSDAVAQLSSVILGLFEEDTVETEIRRKINVLKGRNGEKGEFIINWNFHGMDFSEIASVKDEKGNVVPDTENLQFLG